MKRFLFITIILFLIGTALVPGTCVSSQPVSEDTHSISNLEPHVAIVIEDNSGFQSNGFDGTGTIDNPYTLSGYEFDFSWTCISISDTDAYFEITDCRFSGSEATNWLVVFDNVTNGMVDSCVFARGSTGLRMLSSNDCSVDNITVYNNIAGIFMLDCDRINVTDSKIYENNRGFLLENSNHTLVYENDIYSNDIVGITLDFATSNNTIYDNNIGWNSGQTSILNAVDDGINNTWSYQEDGNQWDDWEEGDYNISGLATSVDPFPTRLEDDGTPEIEPTDDIWFEQDVSNFTIQWYADDMFPAEYEIFREGSFILSGIWGEEIISYSEETSILEVGSHEYVLVVTDAAGNQANETVFVTIVPALIGGMGTEIVLMASILSVVFVVLVLLIIKKL